MFTAFICGENEKELNTLCNEISNEPRYNSYLSNQDCDLRKKIKQNKRYTNYSLFEWLDTYISTGQGETLQKIKKEVFSRHPSLSIKNIDQIQSDGVYSIVKQQSNGKKCIDYLKNPAYPQPVVTELDDVTLLRVEQALDEVVRQHLLLAYGSRKKKEYRTDKLEDSWSFVPVLLLETNGVSQSEGFSRVTYYGLDECFDFLLKRLIDPSLRKYLDIRLAQGKHTVLFSADWVGDHNSDKIVFDELVSDLLNTTLKSGRPVRQFNAQLFLPLPDDFDIKQIKASLGEVNHDDETKNFFIPQIKNKLFDAEIKSYIVKQKQYCSLQFIDPWTNNKVSAALQSLHYHYSEMFETGFFEISLSSKGEQRSWNKKGQADGAKWWYDLFFEPEDAVKAQLINWAHLLYYARQTFQAFGKEQAEKEGKFVTLNLEGDGESEDKNFDNSLDFIAELMNLSYRKGISLSQDALLNDRMFVNAGFALAGSMQPNTLNKHNLKSTFHTLLDIDLFTQADEHTGYVYAPEFIEASQTQVYNRWEHYGSLYGFTDHSNIYTGYGTYIQEHVVSKHVQKIYGKMLLLNLFYQHIIDQMTKKFGESPDANHKGVMKHESNTIKLKLLEFTRDFWFNKVTEQQQGKEIYQLQAYGLNLSQSYQVLDREIEQNNAYQQSQSNNRYATLGLIISALGVVSLILSIMPIAVKGFISPMYLEVQNVIQSSSLANHIATLNPQAKSLLASHGPYQIFITLTVIISSLIYFWFLEPALMNKKSYLKSIITTVIGMLTLMLIMFEACLVSHLATLPIIISFSLSVFFCWGFYSYGKTIYQWLKK